MEFKENQIKPESTRKFLIHQVEEQSDLCDVTIKVGQWEKRFHRCVLIKSPFFDCVFKHDYKETHTGKIEIKLGTPVTVEMAIMFLYGKKPKLTTENAEIMMKLAEYFLIPNLKAACVAWLKKVEVTEQNCLTLLQVASLFDIEIPKCIEFVEGHLESLFENEQFTDIDADSVKYIFTERRFSYLSMDDKLKFLTRWTQVDPVKRCERANEFVELLDFNDISRELLKEFEHNPIYRMITGQKVDAEKVAAKTTADETKRHEVLIMNPEQYGTNFWCLDLTRNKWYKLETVISDSRAQYPYFDILGVQNSMSTVYFLKSSYNTNNIVFFDLETCTFQTFPVVNSDTGEFLSKVDKLAMFADVCVFTENVSVQTNKQTSEGDNELDLRRRLGLMSLVGLGHMEQLLVLSQFENRRISIETTNIHIGRAVNNRIETKQLFTLKGRVSKICMDNLSCVAFITDSNKRIIIYDFNECKMEIIEERTTYNDQLCSAENGFVIFNDKRCVNIQRLQGPALETKYQKKIIEFTLFGKEYSGRSISMHFSKDRWYRYFQRSYQDNHQFECIAHSDILAAEHVDDVAWTPLPLPLEASKCRSNTMKQIYHVRLSKSKLRCDIECPHCEQLKKAKSRSRTVYHTRDSDDDYYYEDSSDNDYYMYGYYDDGYGYYYDSD